MAFSFADIANSSIRHLTPYQPGKPISEVQRELGIKDVIKLASNENPLGASPQALIALQQTLPDLALYPDGSGYALKKALSEHWQIAPDRFTLGNGSDALFVLLGQVFVKPGEKILVSEFAFATFAIAAAIVQAYLVTIPAKNWGHDLDASLQVVTDDTRLIFIANPNNPTGSWHNHEAMRAFLAKLRPDILVVLDEAYAEYMTDTPDYPNSLALQENYPNLIITRTFSKLYGLAGLRVGYAITHPDIAELLNRARLPFNVNSSAMAAAAAALSDHKHRAVTLENNRRGMNYLTTALQELGVTYLPPCANFITLKTVSSAINIYQSLLREGVIVRPLTNYGMLQHLRVSVGTMSENQRFIKSLQNIL